MTGHKRDPVFLALHERRGVVISTTIQTPIPLAYVFHLTMHVVSSSIHTRILQYYSYKSHIVSKGWEKGLFRSEFYVSGSRESQLHTCNTLLGKWAFRSGVHHLGTVLVTPIHWSVA